jgi:hypothetical protein
LQAGERIRAPPKPSSIIGMFNILEAFIEDLRLRVGFEFSTLLPFSPASP